jgi:hypothetical protein
MTADGGQPYVDPQGLADPDMHLYEAVVTLEYLGRPVTRSQIGRAAQVPGSELDRRLDDLTRRRLLIRSDEDGEPAFQPARRDWSAAPGEPCGPRRF